MKKENIIEIFLLIVVLASFVLTPLAVLKINEYYTSSKFPEDAQIITLYGIAEGGVWTQEPVNAFNYWWKKFKRTEEIPIRDDGTPIIFRVTSSDLIHSFAIPLYRIGPYDIKPGEFKEIELKTDKPLRSTRFLCYQYCDEDHEKMHGRLIVLSGEEKQSMQAEQTEPPGGEGGL